MFKEFFLAWQEQRRAAASKRKKSFMRKATDILVAILLVIVGCIYIYNSFVPSVKSNLNASSNNQTVQTSTAIDNKADAHVIKREINFKEYRTLIIDTVIILVALGFYLYLKVKNSKK